MADVILGVDWKDIHSGEFVRWSTPRFVKYGVVKSRDSRGMSVYFAGESSWTVIPEARWYFGRSVSDEEHLAVIESLPYDPRPVMAPTPKGQWLTVQEACEMVKMDSKQLRRHVRRGTVTAKKRDDRWVIDRDQFITTAMDHGWL